MAEQYFYFSSLILWLLCGCVAARTLMRQCAAYVRQKKEEKKLVERLDRYFSV